MTQCIVWLEVDGELKECEVQSPWAEKVLDLDGIKGITAPEELAAMRKTLADQIVASGQFAVWR